MTKTLIVSGLDESPVPHLQDWRAATDPRAHGGLVRSGEPYADDLGD